MRKPRVFSPGRVLLLGLCAALIGTGIFSERGLTDWLRMRGHNARLAARIEALSQEKQDLERRIQRLKTSRFDQREVVRQVLGYVAKNEIIIEF